MTYDGNQLLVENQKVKDSLNIYKKEKEDNQHFVPLCDDNLDELSEQ